MSTGRWFLVDFFLRYRLELVWITFLGAIAASVQTGILIGLHKVMGGGLDAELFHWLSAPHASLMFGAGLAALLTLAACLSYLNSRRTLALWPRYQIHCLNALFGAMHRAAARGVVDAPSVNRSAFRKCLRGAQRIGALSRLVTRGILPFFRFFGFLGYALYVNPMLTLLVLLVVVPLSAFSLLAFSRRAAQCDREAEARARDVSNYLDARQLLALSPEHLAPIHPGASSEGSVLTHRVDQLVARFVWVDRARLATMLITIGALGLVVATFEGGVGAKWGQLLVYLLALMMTFAQLAQLASLVSSVGRFYPTVDRHRKMLETLALSQSLEEFSQRAKAEGLVDNRMDLESDEESE